MSSSFFRRQLANIISLLRIIGVCLIFWLTPFDTLEVQLWTIVVFTLVSATDFLDGFIARKLNIVTDLGKVLDPLADKILILVFLPLVLMKAISPIPVFIILAREFAIMALRVLSAKYGNIVAASTAGKFKTALTLPLCGILFGRILIDGNPETLPTILLPLYEVMTWVQLWPQWIISTLIWSTVVVTIWSFLDYFVAFIWARALDEAKGDIGVARHSIRSLVPNAITISNLLLGIVATGVAYFGHFHYATFLILVCIFLDGLDGRVARWLGVSSDLGAKLDSRADHVSFGVAPAVLVYQMVSSYSFQFSEWLAPVLGLIYYWSVHYRLARFDRSGGHSDCFEGLPSPVGAGFVALLSACTLLSLPWVFIPVVLFTAAIMVSHLPYLHTHASRDTFIGYLHKPTLVFMLLSALMQLPIPLGALSAYRTVPVYILFGLIVLYILSPFYVKKIRDRG